MANTSSAKKAVRSSERKRIINLRRRRDLRDTSKEVRKAVESKDRKSIDSLLPSAFKAIDKAAKMNIIHKNAAARYKSQLAKSAASI